MSGKALYWPSWKDLRFKAVAEPESELNIHPRALLSQAAYTSQPAQRPAPGLPALPAPTFSYMSPPQVARIACGHGW